jgi:cytochrome P450
VSSATRLRSLERVDLGVPGPTPLDMARAFRSVRADPVGFLVEVHERYGDLVGFPVPGAPVLLVTDPTDVRRVLQTSARSWGKQTAQYAALARVTGPGLLASSEDSWIEHRRLAAPAFHHQRLEAVGEQVHAAIDTAVTSWEHAHGEASVVADVAPLMQHIALDAVGRALFSADLSGRARRLLQATSSAADLVVRAGRSILPVPQWAPTPLNARLRSTRRRLDAISAELIAERRGRGGARPSNEAHGDDLMGLLLDSGLSDAAIRDELVTMVIAGHETAAAALMWTLMLLAEHQPAQDRVRAELADHHAPVSLLHHRTQLPWTRAVVDEALRLYPPAWALSRRSREADVIGGQIVPPGTTVIISPWLLHRRSDIWYDSAGFRPERFLASAGSRDGYLPFGMGPRLCIGREFALGEMVMVLSRLLRTRRVRLPDGWRRPSAQARVAVHPRGGMPLVVEPLTGRPR